MARDSNSNSAWHVFEKKKGARALVSSTKQSPGALETAELTTSRRGDVEERERERESREREQRRKGNASLSGVLLPKSSASHTTRGV